jgi:hypothetical protein
MRVQIGDAGNPSGDPQALLVPQDPIPNVQTLPGLVAVPVGSTPLTSVQQPLPATPDLTRRGQPIEMIELHMTKEDENEYGIFCDYGDKYKVVWVPGEQILNLCIATPPSAMATPPLRRVLPTDSSPAAFSPEALANRVRRIRRKVCRLQAELSFLRAQQDHTPPPSRITSDPYSPVSGRAQTVPNTPPTGHGTHSSPVVIGDSPVVLD